MEKQFKIGCKSEIITPPLGTLLFGYTATRPASSVHDDLRTSVVAIEQGDMRAVLISADICNVPKETVEIIRHQICQQTGILEENITMATTHTHSGPAVEGMGAWGETNDAYVNEILIPQTVKAAVAAFNNMKPALMGVGTTESTVGVNRREIDEDGNVILGQNPFGVFDKTMTVLSFRGLDGENIVNIIHYNCHGTSAGRATAITRDWMGPMVDRMEAETGAMTLFFNGAIGDTGPRLSNNRTVGDKDESVENEVPDENLSYLEELGSVAAIDAMRAYRNIKEYREVAFDMIKGTISLPYKKPRSLEEAKAQLENPNDMVNHAGIHSIYRKCLEETIRMYENNEEFETHAEFDQILYLFNSVIFVPFPFEMFSEIQLRLKQYSPFEHTLCLSNANGLFAYLPTQSQICMGGYEVDSFLCKGGAHNLVNNTDDIIIRENMKLIKNCLKK